MFKQPSGTSYAKALEVIDAVDIAENSPRTIAIFTDSRITIEERKPKFHGFGKRTRKNQGISSPI
jgi:hypothetical protein